MYVKYQPVLECLQNELYNMFLSYFSFLFFPFKSQIFKTRSSLQHPAEVKGSAIYWINLFLKQLPTKFTRKRFFTSFMKRTNTASDFSATLETGKHDKKVATKTQLFSQPWSTLQLQLLSPKNSPNPPLLQKPTHCTKHTAFVRN